MREVLSMVVLLCVVGVFLSSQLCSAALQHLPRQDPFGTLRWATTVAQFAPGTTASSGDPSVWCDERLRDDPLAHAQSCLITVLNVAVNVSNNATTEVRFVALNASTGAIRATFDLPVTAVGVPSSDYAQWPSYSGWVSCQPNTTACDVAVTSTAAGIFALSLGSNGTAAEVRWSKWFTSPPPQGTPAHCTVAARAEVVVCTVEAGRQSGYVEAYDVWTGAVAWTTRDQGFTLPWIANDGTSAVYGGRDKTTGAIGIVARTAAAGSPQWTLGNLTFSPPGLWDNPNLDVDSDGACSHRIFMYAKPHIGLRTVTAIDGATGAELWRLSDENATVIVDYDTFAADCDFYRLRIYQPTPQDTPKIVLQRVFGPNGIPRWTQHLANYTDSNAILLVGAGRVFVFGLTTNRIAALTSDDGAPAGGALQLDGTISSGHTFVVPAPLKTTSATQDALVVTESTTTESGSQVVVNVFGL